MVEAVSLLVVEDVLLIIVHQISLLTSCCFFVDGRVFMVMGRLQLVTNAVDNDCLHLRFMTVLVCCLFTVTTTILLVTITVTTTVVTTVAV